MSMQGWQALHSLTRDASVKERRLTPGTTRRVLGYARPYKVQIAWFLGLVVVESVLVVATPLLLKSLIDDGIYPKDSARRRPAVAARGRRSPSSSGALTLVERWFSSRIGEGLIYDLRTEVFSHVLRQPVAFFTRAQTGSLVTRLDNDVIGAQQAFTSVLSSVVSNAIIARPHRRGDGPAVVAADPRRARPRAVLPRPRAAHGPAARGPGARADGATTPTSAPG